MSAVSVHQHAIAWYRPALPTGRVWFSRCTVSDASPVGILPNEPHLHLKGAPITPTAFYFIDIVRVAAPRRAGPAETTYYPSTPPLPTLLNYFRLIAPALFDCTGFFSLYRSPISLVPLFLCLFYNISSAAARHLHLAICRCNFIAFDQAIVSNGLFSIRHYMSDCTDRQISRVTALYVRWYSQKFRASCNK